MTARIPLSAFVVSCALIGAAYALAFLPGGAPPWAAWGLALGSAGALASVMAIGATRGGWLRPAALLASGLTFLVVSGAFACALLLPAREGAGATLLLGLPLRTSIVLYGIGLAPLLFLPLLYAWSFDRDTLNDDDLAQVRRVTRDGDAS